MPPRVVPLYKPGQLVRFKRWVTAEHLGLIDIRTNEFTLDCLMRIVDPAADCPVYNGVIVSLKIVVAAPGSYDVQWFVKQCYLEPKEVRDGDVSSRSFVDEEHWRLSAGC